MSNTPTPHISAKPGDFAKTVLMPGDPLRAKFIAETFLENPVLVNNVRRTVNAIFVHEADKLADGIAVIDHGKVIAEHQMVQQAVADSYAEINMLRLMVLWTAWTIDNSSTQAARTRPATGSVASTRSIRMPRSWWNIPAR